MNARRGQGGDGVALLAVALVIMVAAIGATVLDRAPWLLPWALFAIVLVRLAGRAVKRRRRPVRRRVPVALGVAGVVAAVVIWGGYGRELNQDTRSQLRARPAPAVAAYERQHTRQHPAGHSHRHHATQRFSRDQRGRGRHHHASHTTTRHHRARATPSAAARLYGIKQIGRWHWQRIIAGWSALLGMPLVLWGTAAGIAIAGRRRGGNQLSPPGLSLDQQGAGRLRTAGRGLR